MGVVVGFQEVAVGRRAGKREGLDEVLANVGGGEANERVSAPAPLESGMNWVNAGKRTPCLGKGTAAAASAGEEAAFECDLERDERW